MIIFDNQLLYITFYLIIHLICSTQTKPLQESTINVDILKKEFVNEANPIKEGKPTDKIVTNKAADLQKTDLFASKLEVKPENLLSKESINKADSAKDKCLPKVDLVFLLDTSGSIEQIYQEHVRWAVALIESLPLEQDTVRVAAVQYAGFPLTEFALGTYPNADSIRQHLAQINFQSGVTRTGYALRKAEAELFRSDRGARKDAKKVIVLFTDGLSIDDPLKPAQQLRDLKGVTIYVVSVNEDGFEPEMNRIAGVKSNVFGPEDLSRLRQTLIVEAERARACIRVGDASSNLFQAKQLSFPRKNKTKKKKNVTEFSRQERLSTITIQLNSVSKEEDGKEVTPISRNVKFTSLTPTKNEPILVAKVFESASINNKSSITEAVPNSSVKDEISLLTSLTKNMSKNVTQIILANQTSTALENVTTTSTTIALPSKTLKPTEKNTNANASKTDKKNLLLEVSELIDVFETSNSTLYQNRTFVPVNIPVKSTGKKFLKAKPIVKNVFIKPVSKPTVNESVPSPTTSKHFKPITQTIKLPFFNSTQKQKLSISHSSFNVRVSANGGEVQTSRRTGKSSFRAIPLPGQQKLPFANVQPVLNKKFDVKSSKPFTTTTTTTRRPLTPTGRFRLRTLTITTKPTLTTTTTKKFISRKFSLRTSAPTTSSFPLLISNKPASTSFAQRLSRTKSLKSTIVSTTNLPSTIKRFTTLLKTTTKKSSKTTVPPKINRIFASVILENSINQEISGPNFLNAQRLESFEKPTCPIDWLFIVDSSGSVQNSYDEQKEYLNGILSEIRLGKKEGQRVALLQFAGVDIQKMEWSFDEYTTQDHLMQALKQVRLITGTTFIGAALQSSLRVLETRRSQTPSVIVLVSDGFSQDDALKASELLRKQPDLEFFAMSISKLVNENYLASIVGKPENVFVGPQGAEALRRVLLDRIRCHSRASN